MFLRTHTIAQEPLRPAESDDLPRANHPVLTKMLAHFSIFRWMFTPRTKVCIADEKDAVAMQSCQANLLSHAVSRSAWAIAVGETFVDKRVRDDVKIALQSYGVGNARSGLRFFDQARHLCAHFDCNELKYLADHFIGQPTSTLSSLLECGPLDSASLSPDQADTIRTILALSDRSGLNSSNALDLVHASRGIGLMHSQVERIFFELYACRGRLSHENLERLRLIFPKISVE